MNINTRAETISLSATEQGWLDSLKSLAANVGAQKFVDPTNTARCDKLAKAIDDFRDMMRTLSPKKKTAATA